MSNRPSAQQVVLTSFLVDVSDIVLNVIVAVVSGSVVMLSQAVQGGADLLTSALLLIGTARARRRATREYRFGYGRELFFWVLVASVAMFAVTGLLSLAFGLNRLLHPQPITQLGWSLTVLAIGLATNSYALWLSYRRLTDQGAPVPLWRRFHRSALVETKATVVLDLMGASASLFGLVALILYQLTGDLRFDALGSMVIGLATAGFALGLVGNAKALLVGRSADTELEQRIRRSVESVPGVVRVIQVHTLYIGTEQLLANIDVHCQPGLTTVQLERLTQRIKEQVKADLPLVSHAQIELG